MPLSAVYISALHNDQDREDCFGTYSRKGVSSGKGVSVSGTPVWARSVEMLKCTAVKAQCLMHKLPILYSWRLEMFDIMNI